MYAGYCNILIGMSRVGENTTVVVYLPLWLCLPYLVCGEMRGFSVNHLILALSWVIRKDQNKKKSLNSELITQFKNMVKDHFSKGERI